MQEHTSKEQLRSFGLTVGGIFLAVAIWPLLRRGQDVRAWALVLGSLLVIPGAVAPLILRKPHELWMRLAHVLGWVNTRIILGIVFYLVFTPTAFILRLFGCDPMNRSLVSSADTYRVPREPRDASHMKHQF